jgi:hypothetical protein
LEFCGDAAAFCGDVKSWAETHVTRRVVANASVMAVATTRLTTRRPFIGTLLCLNAATLEVRFPPHAQFDGAEIEPDIRLSRRRAGSVTNVALSRKIALWPVFGAISPGTRIFLAAS